MVNSAEKMKNISLLLVEDESIDAMAYKRFIDEHSLNYSLDIVESALQAKNILNKKSYDIIISDYRLGDGTAMDVLKYTKETPVIISTASGSEEIAVEALRAGASDYLIKDVSGNYLKMLPVTVDKILKQKESQRHELMLSQVLKDMGDSVIILDQDRKIIFVNASFSIKYGYTESEINGKNLQVIWPNKNIPEDISRQALYKGEHTHITKKKTSFPVLVTSTPIFDDKNNPFCYVMVTHDLSDLKYYQNVHKTVIELSSAGILQTDKTDSPLFANPAFLELFKLKSLKELKSVKFSAFFKNENKILFDKLWKNKEKKSVTAELEIERFDKSKKNILFSTANLPSYNGKYSGRISTFTDITARKQAELELEKKAEELKRSNIDLERYAYIASHDLKEPLRMVYSYMELLNKKISSKLDANSKKYINFALDGAVRMDKLISDLLTYSRLGYTPRNYETLNLNRLLENILRDLNTLKNESNSKIVLEQLPQIYADRTQMTQLFQNLISNAIKFNLERKNHKIKITSVEKKNEHLFCIEDNGIGIDPQHFDKVFELFKRLSSTKNTKGTGLGLAICRKIAENHGGKIWVESKPNEITQFYFTIRKRGEQ
ncbi:MAG: ATP-binding protein [Spirochaetia bacterium]|nr:ATP-binding protein [Spirochaetia bacterium]